MDPIADMLSQIQNAENARKTSLVLSYSNLKKAILEVLKKYHFIADYKVENEAKIKVIEVKLNAGSLNRFIRISKPGRRVYSVSARLPRATSPNGLIVISTSEGLMTAEEARKKGLGGEVLAEVA